jgi:hypothetical protein
MQNQPDHDRNQPKPAGDKQKTTSQPSRKPGQGNTAPGDRKK